MSRIGYARVSAADQSTDIQVAALQAAGCGVIRQEKASGTDTVGRPQLAIILDFIQHGDVLVITRIDRLARSVLHLQTIVQALQAKGASLECIEQPVDMRSPAGKAFLDMLGVFAEFETALRRERQMEGIAKAKAAGVYTGRKPTIRADQVRALASDGIGATEIAQRLGIGRASVYRALAAA